MNDARRRFDSFVILAGMRTGSNFLEANLNALPGVTCHGEVFNPHFIGKKIGPSCSGSTWRPAMPIPMRLLAAMRAGTEGCQGSAFSTTTIRAC